MGNLTADARRSALACLARFGERLAGFHPSAVRAVATNTFRVARNAASFLAQAERALGFPIDVISGHEEARLIYVGVAHVLPPCSAPRLVVDIGGGSTEFIIGRGLEPQLLDSLKIGCVGMSQRFFGDGALTAAASPRPRRRRASRSRRSRAISIALTGTMRTHRRAPRWRSRRFSSRTECRPAVSRPTGLARLRHRLIAAGHVSRLKLAALKPERAPVLAGGFAIMSAALAELDVSRINPVGGALRLGVLYDLLGRSRRTRRARRDGRAIPRRAIASTATHAQRVAAMAVELVSRRRADALPRQSGNCSARRCCTRPASRCRTPGFTSTARTSCATPTCRDFRPGPAGASACSCSAAAAASPRSRDALDPRFRAQLCALRLAVLFHHARRPIAPPRLALSPVGSKIRFGVPGRWLARHPLTAHLLQKEAAKWRALGLRRGSAR